MQKYIGGLIFLFLLSCQLKDPPVFFSQEALQDEFVTINGETITLASILDIEKNKNIVIDIWASWCRDCIKGFPKLKRLQMQYPEVNFVFLSLDNDQTSWKKGIRKYDLKGQHYFMKSGMKGDLGRFINLDWIPRYLVVNKQREIKIFKAINAQDIHIKKILDQIH